MMSNKKILPFGLILFTSINSLACNKADNTVTRKDDQAQQVKDLHSGDKNLKELSEGFSEEHKAVLLACKNPNLAFKLSEEHYSLVDKARVEDLRKALQEDGYEKIQLQLAMLYLHHHSVISDADMFAYEKEFGSSAHNREAITASYTKFAEASPLALSKDLSQRALKPEQAKVIWQLRKIPHVEELKKACESHDLNFNAEEIKALEQSSEISKIIAKKKKEKFQENQELLGEKRKKIFDYAFKLGIEENKIYNAFTVKTEVLFNYNLERDIDNVDPESDANKDMTELDSMIDNISLMRRSLAGVYTEHGILSLVKEAILDDFEKSQLTNTKTQKKGPVKILKYSDQEATTLALIGLHERFKLGELEASEIKAELEKLD